MKSKQGFAQKPSIVRYTIDPKYQSNTKPPSHRNGLSNAQSGSRKVVNLNNNLKDYQNSSNMQSRTATGLGMMTTTKENKTTVISQTSDGRGLGKTMTTNTIMDHKKDMST